MDSSAVMSVKQPSSSAACCLGRAADSSQVDCSFARARGLPHLCEEERLRALVLVLRLACVIELRWHIYSCVCSSQGEVLMLITDPKHREPVDCRID
jgi:hypothetical protein